MTAFHDLDSFLALPRLDRLALSPDGARLVVGVSTLHPSKTMYVTSLWEIDPLGERPATRVTRSAKGETAPAFLPDGSLLFCSTRHDPTGEEEEEEGVGALWLLPAGGGEAWAVAARPSGIDDLVVSTSGAVVVSSAMLSASDEANARARKRRKDLKVSAILHERFPVRHWDHDLGPEFPHLFAGTWKSGDDPTLSLRDLAPDADQALINPAWDVSPDGSAVATEWQVPIIGGRRSAIALIDIATCQRRLVANVPDRAFFAPRWSPDGTRVALVQERFSAWEAPGEDRLVLLDVDSGEMTEVAPRWDRWPLHHLRWTPDGSAVLLVADDHGRAPVFRVEVATGEVTRLTGDDYAYSDLEIAPDGQTVYALRSSWHEPPTVVRLDATAPDQSSVPLRGPAEAPALPGTLTEVETTTTDGARVRAWLTLPHGAAPESPAPLVVWIHGGPYVSWNRWSWRWNPWVLVANGYAVLMPDLGMSTGYGMDFIRRCWGLMAEVPFADLMAVTDAAGARDDIDGTRSAAMGASYGGYLASWVAGHTDRFRCIVTHAGMWALDQYLATTDFPWEMRRELSPEIMRTQSPHRHIEAIRTPMLVIHGDKDYRVPIGQAIRLWSELAVNTGSEAGELGHKFLYFPDENHWILKPQNAKVWYETVGAFLGHHVLGEDWRPPEILR